MSATTAAPQTKEDFGALMSAMGGDQWDPFPPGQYLAFLDPKVQLSPRGRNALAWLQSNCLRPKRKGRTPYATDERGKSLRLKDLGVFFSWDPPATTRVWKEIEDADFAHKDEKGWLWLHAEPNPTGKSTRKEVDKDPLNADRLPKYVIEQIRDYPEERRRRIARMWQKLDELETDAIADAVFAVRDQYADRRAAILAQEGVSLRRHASTAEDEAKREIRRAMVHLPELSVQVFFDTLEEQPVQPIESTVYTEENDDVQDGYPYSLKEKEFKVSSEDAGTESGLTCEDSPTPQDEAEAIETQDEGEPEAAPPQEQKNAKLPVEKKTPEAAGENNTVVAFVENYFGEALNPTLRAEWAGVAAEADVSPTSVVRFLMEKTAEKETKAYDGFGPKGLLQFTRLDLKRWKKTHRAFIARDLEREQAQERTTAPPAPRSPQEHPIEALIRSFEINSQFLEMFPTHRDAPRTRQLFAADREKLEQELGNLLNRVHTATDDERALMQRLKTLLSTKAEGAAG